MIKQSMRVLLVLSLSAGLLLLSPLESIAEQHGKTLVGFLQNVVLEPPVVQLDHGNFTWGKQTLFLNRSGELISLDRFLKRFRNQTVELRLDENGTIVQANPIDY